MKDRDPYDLGGEPSDWREHKEVFDSMDAERRDPLELKIQQLWVAIEMVKRETAEGDTQLASEALEHAEQTYAQIPLLVQNSQLPRDEISRLKQRVDQLKREIDSLA